MFRRSWRSQMTASEGQRGAVFFLLYLLVFPRLNAWVQRMLMGDGEALAAEANVIYYLFLFIITLFVFWGFLRKDLEQLLDWLPENLFGVVLGLALAGGVALLLRQIPFLPVNPISRQYAEEFAAAPTATLVLILVLIPVVEEVTPEIEALAGGKGSELATGGMETKLRAAKMVTAKGCDMVITNGERPERLYDIAGGKAVGTRFLGKR